MRATVTLDADTEQLIRRRMRERGLSFKEAVNDAIRQGSAGAPPAFRTETAPLGRASVNLDRALPYAVNEDADRHEPSRRWLDTALSGQDTVASAWISLFLSPVALDAAMDRVDAWLATPPAVVLEPTVDHPRLVRELLRPIVVGGNLVNDANLAALALEHRCALVSFDLDFGRFADVRCEAPAG